MTGIVHYFFRTFISNCFSHYLNHSPSGGRVAVCLISQAWTLNTIKPTRPVTDSNRDSLNIPIFLIIFHVFSGCEKSSIHLHFLRSKNWPPGPQIFSHTRRPSPAGTTPNCDWRFRNETRRVTATRQNGSGAKAWHFLVGWWCIGWKLFSRISWDFLGFHGI